MLLFLFDLRFARIQKEEETSWRTCSVANGWESTTRLKDDVRIGAYYIKGQQKASHKTTTEQGTSTA